MRYTVVERAELDKERMRKISGLESKGCVSMHLVVFRSKEKVIVRREYVCDCNGYLAVDFEKFTKNEDAACNLNDEEFYDEAEECELDGDDGASQGHVV